MRMKVPPPNPIPTKKSPTETQKSARVSSRLWSFYFFFFLPHPRACGILVPAPGFEPMLPLQWKNGVLTTELPEKSPYFLKQFFAMKLCLYIPTILFKKYSFIYLTASGLLIVATLGLFLASCDIFHCRRTNCLVAESRLSSSETCGS